jgi:hypothetical protein
MRKTPKHHGWRSGLAVAGGGRQPLDRRSLQEAERLGGRSLLPSWHRLVGGGGVLITGGGLWGSFPLPGGVAGQEAASGVGHWRSLGSLGRGRGGRARTGAMVWCTWSALKVGCWAISHTDTYLIFIQAQYTDMHWIIHIGYVRVSGWTPQSRVPQIRTDARDGLVAWLDKICLHKLLDLS